MSYWLLKTEPSDYSYADLERDRRTVWDGVANNAALKHMRAVREGDEALIYHTGKERRAVGVARVVSDPYPDPQSDDERLVVFEIEPLHELATPAPLAEIKQNPDFTTFDLVRIPRLSVMPVPPNLWRKLTSWPR